MNETTKRTIKRLLHAREAQLRIEEAAHNRNPNDQHRRVWGRTFSVKSDPDVMCRTCTQYAAAIAEVVHLQQQIAAIETKPAKKSAKKVTAKQSAR